MDWTSKGEAGGARVQVPGQRCGGDCIWGGAGSRKMLAVREGPWSWGLGNPFSGSLQRPEGQAGRMRSGVWSLASGGSELGRPSRAGSMDSCRPRAFDATEMETHTRPTIN